MVVGTGWGMAQFLTLIPTSSTPSEVKLSVVTYLTNSVVEEILQELYSVHKSLVSPPTLTPPPWSCYGTCPLAPHP